MMNPDEINEERRLAYVGITRAKEKLYLTKTKSRMLFGSTTYNKESRFVSEIPEELVERSGETRMYTNNFSSAAGSENRISIGVKTKSVHAPSRLNSLKV